MSELEDILNYLETTSLESHDDYVSEFSYKSQKTLWKYIKDLRLENQELRKQLEEKENQQEEFIEYLKDKEKQFDVMGDPINSGACLGILRKYKEIIGGKDE